VDQWYESGPGPGHYSDMNADPEEGLWWVWSRVVDQIRFSKFDRIWIRIRSEHQCWQYYLQYLLTRVTIKVKIRTDLDPVFLEGGIRIRVNPPGSATLSLRAEWIGSGSRGRNYKDLSWKGSKSKICLLYELN